MTRKVRSKLSTFGFGGPTEVTCGGNALKFYASVRLNIRRTGLIKRGEEVSSSILSFLFTFLVGFGFSGLRKFLSSCESALVDKDLFIFPLAWLKLC